jgi:uncharacterized protein YcbK (DUF882 family)
MRIRGIAARCAVLGAGFMLLASASSSLMPQARALGETRTLTMYNIHTKETVTVTFKRDGKYDDDGLKKLNTFMRDWRAEEETKMDPQLIDLIWTLHRDLRSREPIHLISGFRSAKTNAKMRRKGGGQAKRSQHIQGKAADIHFPDVQVKTLRNSALVREIGGVGYYPTSGIPFVHVDTGNVRMWPRIPRLELAALFPDGDTKYLPKDGKPITKTDYKLALAKGMVQSRTMVASAEPGLLKPSIEAEAEEAPKLILASFSPETIPAELKVTQDARQPPPPGRLFAYASAGGVPFARPSIKPKTTVGAAGNFPLYHDAEVVSAPEVDDDHPDEASYVPFEIATLMTDESIAYSRTVAPLVHPAQGNLDHVFEGMERPSNFQLRKTSGYTGLASAQQFSGQAVKSLYAEMEPAKSAPTRLASKH